MRRSRSIRFDEKGLVAAIVQDRSTRDVLMLGWMDAEALRRTLDDRANVVLEPEPAGVLVQG